MANISFCIKREK